MGLMEVLKMNGAGQASWVIPAFAAVGAVASYTDYRSGKIYNWLTLPAMALGLLIAASFGAAHLAAAAAGVVLGLAFFLPLNAAGVIGAGDAKLAMAYGSVLGALGVLDLIFWSFIIAGMASVVILLVRGRCRHFVKETGAFLRSLVTPGLALHWPRLDRASKARFGLAIFAGFLLREALR